MMANPVRLAESQMTLWWDYMSLWQASFMKMMGAPSSPVAAPVKGDKRFRHEDWEQHVLFDFVKQSYLITARWMHDQVANVEGLDEKTRRKVDFYTRQYIDALAPSNFALTNPEVFRETIATGGQNLVRGLHNLLDDIERGNGQLKISMTDPKAFELGVNIATTPGKVVFRNELMRADAVHADDREGRQAAAADHPAVDQQVLHPRPAREELVRQVVRRPGHDDVRRVLGEPRREARRRRIRPTISPTARSRRSTRSARPPARRRSTRSATASAARCSRRRWATWRRTRTSASPAPRS